jgi:general secretion pathway protein F
MRYRVLAARRNEAAQSFVVDAMDPIAAAARIAEQGFAVIGTDAVASPLSLRIGALHKDTFPASLFAVELLALLKAGLNVVEAAQTLSTKESSGAYRSGLDRINDALNRGNTFSDALLALDHALPPLFVTTIHAAEGSGALQQSLARYVDYDQALSQARVRVASAAIYPAVLVVVGSLVMAFLMLYVVPRFARIYDDMHQALPLFSSLLFGVGRWIGENTVLVGTALIGLIGFAAALALSPSLQARAWSKFDALPTVGRWVRLFHLARLYRSLALLLQSGIPLVQALQAARPTLPAVLHGPAQIAFERISEGRGVSLSMTEAGLTTPVATQLLAVGERTGELGLMMGRLADFQDEELARMLDRAMRLMEPALMTVIGVIVGAILVLMYMPIFELAGSLQ